VARVSSITRYIFLEGLRGGAILILLPVMIPPLAFLVAASAADQVTHYVSSLFTGSSLTFSKRSGWNCTPVLYGSLTVKSGRGVMRVLAVKPLDAEGFARLTGLHVSRGCSVGIGCGLYSMIGRVVRVCGVDGCLDARSTCKIACRWGFPGYSIVVFDGNLTLASPSKGYLCRHGQGVEGSAWLGGLQLASMIVLGGYMAAAPLAGFRALGAAWEAVRVACYMGASRVEAGLASALASLLWALAAGAVGYLSGVAALHIGVKVASALTGIVMPPPPPPLGRAIWLALAMLTLAQPPPGIK
jgi:hypothetical protein